MCTVSIKMPQNGPQISLRAFLIGTVRILFLVKQRLLALKRAVKFAALRSAEYHKPQHTPEVQAELLSIK
jgi:hypothetical protein